MGGSSSIPETPLSREQADIAKKQYQDYQARWSPVIEFFKNRTDRDTGGKRALLKGQTNVDLRSRFGQAAAGVDKTLKARGVRTGSGRDVEAHAGLSDALGSAEAGGMAGADSAVDAQYLRGIQEIVGIGRNQRVSADESLGKLSSISGQAAAANAQAAGAQAAGLGEAIGTGVGFGASYGLNYKKPPTDAEAGVPSYLSKKAPAYDPTPGIDLGYLNGE